MRKSTKTLIQCIGIACMLLVMQFFPIAENVNSVQASSNFENDLAAFPSSYHNALRELNKKYPNWRFEAVNTGLDWNTLVEKQSRLGLNLISNSADKAYIDLTDVNANGQQIIRDGSTWVQASRGAIMYYLDPRNFLTDPSIFMFEALSYSTSQTEAGVKSILNGTFMSDTYTTPDGRTIAYSTTLMDASKTYGVSAYHAASRLRQEQGVSGNALSRGMKRDPQTGNEIETGYYNFFNIGAYNGTVNGVYLTVTERGAWYASGSPNQSGGISDKYGRPWTDQEKALKGGIQFLGESYINVGQDTIYFQKFDIKNHSHQYMSNVRAPASEASSAKKGYSADILNGALVFKIPVYTNMPSTAVAPPTLNVSNPTHTINCTVANGVIYQIEPKTSVDALLQKITVKDGVVAIYNSGGTKISGGTAVGTGTKVRILNNAGSTVAEYTVLIYGDLTGDGQISITDLVASRRHLLGERILKDHLLLAGDFNKDGNLSIVDHITIQKHLLGLKNITQ